MDALEILLPKISTSVKSCRLSIPIAIKLRCLQVNEPHVHIEKLDLHKLPTTVLDLKKLISIKLNIPLICILRLSVSDILLSDEQVLKDICIRGSDDMYLEYFAMCEEDKYIILINQGKTINDFCNNYLAKMESEAQLPNFALVQIKSNDDNTINNIFKNFPHKNPIKNTVDGHSKISPSTIITQQMKSDINKIIWVFNFMYYDLLLPWKDENTLCHRLYIIQEDLLNRIVEIWRWSIVYKQPELQEALLLVFWDFGENWIERIILFELGIHVDALNLFFANDTRDYVKKTIIGMLSGYGEFPLGQKELGSNAEFLVAITHHLDSCDYYMRSMIGVLLFMLASCPCVPIVMMKSNILEIVLFITEDLDYGCIQNIEYACSLCLFFMVLLKSPDYSLPEEIEIIQFCNIFLKFHQYTTAELLFHSEEKQISWASDVPFLDLFFTPINSPLLKFSKEYPELLIYYYKIAYITLSATLMASENRKLLLDENLYGYLIIIYWREKNIYFKNVLLNIMNRFKPTPYSIPSLLQIAIAQHAHNSYGLAAALELIS